MNPAILWLFCLGNVGIFTVRSDLVEDMVSTLTQAEVEKRANDKRIMSVISDILDCAAQCFNGGEQIISTYPFGVCECKCPHGYSGIICQNKVKSNQYGKRLNSFSKFRKRKSAYETMRWLRNDDFAYWWCLCKASNCLCRNSWFHWLRISTNILLF